MVRRRLTAALAALILAACDSQEEMVDSLEMPDTMAVRRALEETDDRGALLDTMPGGEMAIGDSATEMELLKDKMPEEAGP